MPYTVAYNTSVGMLTVPARTADEAMGQARRLLREGRTYVKIIDASGHKLDPADLERDRADGRA